MNKIIITKESEPIKYLIKKDKKIIILFELVGELTYSLDKDYYGFIIKTIIGQMLSNKVGDIITDRLLKLCKTGRIDIVSISALSFDEIFSIGISRKKTQCIIDFTQYYIKNEYKYKKISKLTDEDLITEITSIKGLGLWSAKMFLLFVLGRDNIIPYEDTAYQQAFNWYHGLSTFPSKTDVLKLCQKWNPYNSIVARYLYIALDSNLTKKSFASYKKIKNKNYT
jgi:DNA-3-methyladenine glycosylase II